MSEVRSAPKTVIGSTLYQSRQSFANLSFEIGRALVAYHV